MLFFGHIKLIFPQYYDYIKVYVAFFLLLFSEELLCYSEENYHIVQDYKTYHSKSCMYLYRMCVLYKPHVFDKNKSVIFNWAKLTVTLSK